MIQADDKLVRGQSGNLDWRGRYRQHSIGFRRAKHKYRGVTIYISKNHHTLLTHPCARPTNR